MSDQHNAARDYIDRGWPVFPLVPRGKNPITTHGLKDATTEKDMVDAWWTMYPDANVAIVTGIKFDVLDLDGPEAVDRFKTWCADHDVNTADLKKAVSRTSKGWHYLFTPSGIGNRAKLLNAPIDWRGKGGYIVAPPSVHPSGHVYRWAIEPNGHLPDVPAALRDLLAPPVTTGHTPQQLHVPLDRDTTAYARKVYTSELEAMKAAQSGARNDTLFRCATNLLEMINGGHLPAGALDDLAAAARATGLTDREIDTTLTSAHRTTNGKARDIPAPVALAPARPTQSPAPAAAPVIEPTVSADTEPDPAMWFGFLGEITEALDPWTEASRVGVLVSLLAGIGCCIGPTPHALVSTTRHPLLVWPLLLGPTASGRKGTAQDMAETVIGAAQPDFIADNVTSGLSSGEGLIHLVRDTKYAEGDHDTGQPKIIDAGVEDKRRWVVETEYGGTMARAKREGSSLSAVLRQAWDAKPLSILTKTSVSARGAHIAISAHVTPGEFLARLRDTDMAGGTYNRFLPVLVDRSKFLPQAPAPPAAMINDFGARLREAMTKARSATWVPRTEAANREWEGIYRDLNHTDGDNDRLGQFIARCVPYTLRLAVLYALIEGHRTVDVDHLRAAHAVVRYSIASVRKLLSASEDTNLPRLVTALKDAGEAGMTRTEVNRFFHGRLTSGQLDELLGLVPGLEVGTSVTGGRPGRVYVVRGADKEADEAPAVDPAPGTE